jgi:hypothetical protein
MLKSVHYSLQKALCFDQKTIKWLSDERIEQRFEEVAWLKFSVDDSMLLKMVFYNINPNQNQIYKNLWLILILELYAIN